MRMDFQKARFGPAGIPDAFYGHGNDSSVQMPAWLGGMGLDAFEYQCSRGVRIKEPMARRLGSEASEHGIVLSVHAPYYINLASEDTDRRKKSVEYIMQTAAAASWMGARRIVVHLGSCSGISRKRAAELITQELKYTIRIMKEMGLDHIGIRPETMGKINQFGSLDEIIEICRIDESLEPAVDFGHLYARGMGIPDSENAFAAILNAICDRLGSARLKNLHCHFSRIEFTKGGERRHLMLEDPVFGPDFTLLARAFAAKRIAPVVICESREDMAAQALILKNIYLKILGEAS